MQQSLANIVGYVHGNLRGCKGPELRQIGRSSKLRVTWRRAAVVICFNIELL
jgi:hypothetical protein